MLHDNQPRAEALGNDSHSLTLESLRTKMNEYLYLEAMPTQNSINTCTFDRPATSQCVSFELLRHTCVTSKQILGCNPPGEDKKKR